MENSANISRKNFIKTIFWAGMFLPFLNFCAKKTKSFLVKISGTNHILGHRLWAKDFPKPTEIIKTKFLVVGGGISGLSACRYFKQNGIDDFLLLEMEKKVGGNSSNGENKFSKFPLGAHYLPLPDKENTEIIEFLRECKIYLGDDEKGQPILDDYQLSFPQQERLFYRNSWQNDLVPQNGISDLAKKEIERFFQITKEFRQKKDNSGKYWFAIPLKDSAEESRFLDKITFKNWLKKENFQSEELLWYLDYSCRDDYGFGIDSVSAWAGIHYFAGRKNNWSPKNADQVFTWPEGNSRLASHLSKFSEKKTMTDVLVYSVKTNPENVEVFCFDNHSKVSKKIIAEKVLFATPQFVNNRILENRKVQNFNYVPWLLATITLDNSFGGDEDLAWDNVIFGAKGLGYINDRHQNLEQILDDKVITYYYSFSDADCKKSRKKLYKMTDSDLKNLILEELKTAHPEIENFIKEIEFRKLGHAMIAPVPNQIFGEETAFAQKNLDGKIFFAHSDLSGISIFEEAFYQGLHNAKAMI